MKVETKLTAQEIFKFSLIYSYSGVPGLLSVFVILMGVFMMYRGFFLDYGVGTGFLGIGFVAVFIILNPLMLYAKSKKQIATNEAYKNPTTYILSDKGVRVEVGEQSGELEWWRIVKVKHLLGLYLFYTGKQQAFIFPETALGDREEEVISYMKEHIAGGRTKYAGKNPKVASSISKYTKKAQDDQESEETTEDKTEE